MAKDDFIEHTSAETLNDARSVADTLSWNADNEAVGHDMLAGLAADVWKDDPARSLAAVSLVLALTVRYPGRSLREVRNLLSDALLQKLKRERRYPDVSEPSE